MKLEIFNNNDSSLKYNITDFSIEYNIPKEYRPFKYDDLIIDFDHEFGFFTCDINYENKTFDKISSNGLFQLNSNLSFKKADFLDLNFYKEIKYCPKNDKKINVFSLLDNNESNKMKFAYIYVKKPANTLFVSSYSDETYFLYNKTIMKNNGDYQFTKYQEYLIKYFSVLNFNNCEIKKTEIACDKMLPNKFKSITNIKFNNKCQLLKIICYFKFNETITSVELNHNFENDSWEIPQLLSYDYNYLLNIKIYYAYIIPEVEQRFNFAFGSSFNSNVKTLTSKEFAYYFINNHEEYGLIIYDDYLKYSNEEILNFKITFNNKMINKFNEYKLSFNLIEFKDEYKDKILNILNLINSKYSLFIRKNKLSIISEKILSMITFTKNKINNLIDNKKNDYNNNYLKNKELTNLNIQSLIQNIEDLSLLIKSKLNF